MIDTADMPSQYNSPIYRAHRPRADAACVALVRKVGLPCVTLPAQLVGYYAEDGRVLLAAEWARMNLPYQEF